MGETSGYQVPIRYVGQKRVKRDNVTYSGTLWQGNGDEQMVDVEIAAKLLRHPTVWELAANPADLDPQVQALLGVAPPSALAPPPAQRGTNRQPPPPVHAKDNATLTDGMDAAVRKAPPAPENEAPAQHADDDRAAAPEKVKTPTPPTQPAGEPPLPNLEDIEDKEALETLARERYGVDLDKRFSFARLRRQIRALEDARAEGALDDRERLDSILKMI